MAKRVLVMAVVSERQAAKLRAALPKEAVCFSQEVEVERLVYPEQAMAMGKRAGAQICQQLREFGNTL